MDFVRMRHGNAVWHLVTGQVVCTYEYLDYSVEHFTFYCTPCEPDGYTWEGPRTEVVTASEPPGRLCRVCSRKMEAVQP